MKSDLREIALKKISESKKKLSIEGYQTHPVVEKKYNFEFDVIINGKIFKILFYFGKKGVKFVLQGDRNNPDFGMLENIIEGQPKLDFPEQKIIEPGEYIGTDESGKGDFFGPLVTSAVYIDEDVREKLIKAGVKDSKELNEASIHRIAKQIKSIVKFYDIISIQPEKYNQLMAKLNNLNSLLNWAHSKSIENLLKKVDAKVVITDEFSKKALFIESKPELGDIQFIKVPKGERYIAVAAASILARDGLNQWFDQQRKKGLILPKGASEKVEVKASAIISEMGEERLMGLAKLHFKTLKKSRAKNRF